MTPRPTLVIHDAQLADLALGEHGAAAYATDGAQVLHVFLKAAVGRPTGAPVAAKLFVIRQDELSGALRDAAEGRVSPDAKGLALRVFVGEGGADGARNVHAWLRRESEVLECDVVRVPTGSDLFSRSRGLLETDALARRTVGIVGVGSGGSAVAVELAKAGVGHFVLVDPDHLELANLSRHACGLSDLGRAKVHAVRDLLLDRNPDVTVAAHPLDVLASPEAARTALADVDLLIGATDGNRSRAWINRLALGLDRPAIFGRALTRAAGGDVVRVRPRLGPCLACVFAAGLEREEEVSSARDAASAPAYTTPEQLQALVQPGLAADIAPIANMMVRLALLELSRGTSAAITSLDEDLSADLYIWANRRERSYASWPPMGFGSRAPSILRWYGAEALRSAGCLECSTATVAPVQLTAGPPSWA